MTYLRLKVDRQSFQRFAISLAMIVSCLSFAGCETLFHSDRIDNQQKAGSTFLSVVSIAPWDDYKDSVKIQFSLTPENALAQVLPNTMSFNEQSLQAFGGQLKAALPGSSVAGTSTVSTTNGVVSSTSQQTQTTSLGSVSNIASVPSPAGTVTIPAALSGLNASTSDDPMLKYWAGTALYQEVQLLNKYIDDAAVGDNSQFIPYVMRLEVSYMPLARNEPYDVYTTLSFFNGAYPPIDQFAQFPAAGTKPHALAALPAESDSDAAPRIVPLLVTDDIEAMLHANSLEKIQQLELALAATVQGVGLSGDVQNKLDKLQNVIGNDFNSTFAIARVSDNTLRVRLGARYSPTSKYTQVAQTHYVTVLVLVPVQKGNHALPIQNMHITAETRLVSADKGKTLASISDGEIVQKAQSIVRKYDKEQVLKEAGDILPLWYDVEENLYSDFDAYINTHAPGLRFRQALWLDLASLQDVSKFAFARVYIPVKTTVYYPQQGFLFDNTNNTAITIVGDNIKPNGLWAEWTLTDSTGARVTTIPSQKVSVVQPNEVDITFPSLKSIGLESAPVNKVTLHRKDQVVASIDCHYYLAPAKDTAAGGGAQFTMSTGAKSVIADKDGLGTLNLSVTSALSGAAAVPVLVTITGADTTGIADLHSVAQPLQEASWKLPVNSIYKINLANLVPYSTVTIQAKASAPPSGGGTAQTAKIDVPVIALPHSKQ